MRLGQISRQLETDSEEIIRALSENGFDLQNHPNTKLGSEELTLINDLFKKDEAEPTNEETGSFDEDIMTEIPEEIVETGVDDSVTLEPTEEQIIEEPIVESQEIEIQETASTDTKVAQKEVTVSDLVQDADENEENTSLAPPSNIKEFSADEAVPDNLDTEIIKAPKVKLEGFKVLGKIELPEKEEKTKKEKEQIKAETNIEDADEKPVETVETDSQDGLHPSKRVRIVGATPEKAEVKPVAVEQKTDKTHKKKKSKKPQSQGVLTKPSSRTSAPANKPNQQSNKKKNNKKAKQKLVEENRKRQKSGQVQPKKKPTVSKPLESTASEKPKKKGFFARLFGK